MSISIVTIDKILVGLDLVIVQATHKRRVLEVSVGEFVVKLTYENKGGS